MNRYSRNKFFGWLKALDFLIFLKLSAFFFFKRLLNKSANFFYSHTGEDIIISYLLDKKKKGFYIDVGCNHPVKNNNTYLFYLEGWRGICIDPDENLINLFKKHRKKDIALRTVISNQEQEVTFYKSTHSEVSTINKEVHDLYKQIWAFDKSEKLIASTLTSVLNQHLQKGQEIDFLSIDVEGHELEVLESLDFEKYRPKVIIVEAHEFTLDQLNTNPVVCYLKQFNYVLKYYATKNLYFIESSFKGDYFDVLNLSKN